MPEYKNHKTLWLYNLLGWSFNAQNYKIQNYLSMLYNIKMIDSKYSLCIDGKVEMNHR